jgi:exodeoxyribonuclease VII small subunit
MNPEISFETALGRLEEIVSEVKREDVSLDKSLELLEEGVRLANACTEKTDHSCWREEVESST